MTAIDVERLRKMGACEYGRESVRKYGSMGEWWETTDRVDWMLWLCERIGCDATRLQRFALWCARRVQHLTEDQRVAESLDIVERYLDGGATTEELMAAREAVGEALKEAVAARAARAAAAARAAWLACDAEWEAPVAWAAAMAALEADDTHAAQRTHLRELFPASEIQRLWDEKHLDGNA